MEQIGEIYASPEFPFVVELVISHDRNGYHGSIVFGVDIASPVTAYIIPFIHNFCLIVFYISPVCILLDSMRRPAEIPQCDLLLNHLVTSASTTPLNRGL